MITYYGGKAGLAEWIISLMPPHRVYVEPFAGGLAVLFRKPPAQIEVVNDRDERIANIYRVLQEDATARELVSRLWLTPYARTEHARARRAMRDPEATEVERAWGALVDLGQGINCMFGSGWRSSTGADGERSAVVQPSSFQAQVERIIEALPRLRLLEVENRDALEVIERHDGPETLVYCDPPYPGSDQGHYKGYSMDDFLRLWDLLSRIRGAAMVSCYSGTVTEEMAAGWHVERRKRTIHTNRHCKDKEGRVVGSERIEEVWIRSGVPPQQRLF